MAESRQDPMNILLNAALDVYLDHEPDDDGKCPQPNCDTDNSHVECLPYRTADIVLTMWAGVAWMSVTTSRANNDH